jgi:hypothetical protein
MFVPRSNRGSRHIVRDICRSTRLILFFTQRIFMMEQHQWTPNSIAEMAPRYHHFHVRIVDVALGLVRRTHVNTWNSSLNACYDSDHASVCINRMMAAHGLWLPTMNDILRINVSTAQYRVLASYHYIIQASPVN